jgi:tetratricopeptide (TPR) repeat protein
LFNPNPTSHVLAKRREALAQAGELAGVLSDLRSVVLAPTSVDVQAVSSACVQVVTWALERRYTQMAIEFAEAAAMVNQTDPSLANLAGRVTRNATDFTRAEVWFNRGIGLSRVAHNRIELVRGHLGYGILCQEVGRIRAAMRHFNSGSRIAKKQGLEWLAAEVQHDVALLHTARGRYADARRHAQRALNWYPKRHPRFPFFAADIALLLALDRNYALAGRIAKSVLRHMTQPSARAVILALNARAAVGAGLVDELDPMRRRILRILKDHPEREAIALWHIAAAERLAGRWEAAAASGTHALELAHARGDRETAFHIERLLRKIRARKPAPPPRPMRNDAEFAAFIQTLANRLSAWAPGGRGLTSLRAGWAA